MRERERERERERRGDDHFEKKDTSQPFCQFLYSLPEFISLYLKYKRKNRTIVSI